jgi:hypothetical protein
LDVVDLSKVENLLKTGKRFQLKLLIICKYGLSRWKNSEFTLFKKFKDGRIIVLLA